MNLYIRGDLLTSSYSFLCLTDEASPLLKILTLHKNSSDTAAPSGTAWVQGWVPPEGPLHHPHTAPADMGNCPKLREASPAFDPLPLSLLSQSESKY